MANYGQVVASFVLESRSTSLVVLGVSVRVWSKYPTAPVPITDPIPSPLILSCSWSLPSTLLLPLDFLCERKYATFLSESSFLSFTWWMMSSPIYFAPNDMTSFSFMAWLRLSYFSARHLCSLTILCLHRLSMGWVVWSESCLPCPGRSQAHLPVFLARCPEAGKGFCE